MSAVYRHEAVVPFQHVDAAGIVFFARTFDYFHDAWVGLLEDAGQPLPEVLRSGAWIAPLVHAEADYKRPLRFGDRIRVLITEVATEGSKAVVSYRIEVDGGTAAVGKTVHMWLSKDMARIPIPDGLVERFARLSD